MFACSAVSGSWSGKLNAYQKLIFPKSKNYTYYVNKKERSSFDFICDTTSIHECNDLGDYSV